MKNFLTEAEFLPTLKSGRSVTVTTDYNRPETEVPFVNRIVLNKLQSDCVVEVEKVKGAYRYKVTRV
ncbi:MAG: hypothetical protein LC650_03945 [Actinobacteria bacterium]|nr:hypothetical protein [Actinomycetota bacterium]